MATPPGDGGNVPREGFYPDPSIPGYVRYWNGASWVPGTSRPAPQGGEAMPGTSATAPPAVDETGPVFLDDERSGGSRQEPASAWQADASRQTGFGGERDARVSWGAPGQAPRVPGDDPRGPGQDPRIPGQAAAPADSPNEARPPSDPTGGALPGVRTLGPGSDDGRPPTEGTVAIRATRPGGRPGGRRGAGPGSRPESGAGSDRPDAGQEAAAGTPGLPAPREGGQPPDSTMTMRALRAARRAKDEEADSGRTGQAEGTMAIRALNPGGSGTGTAPGQPKPLLPSRSQPQQTPRQQPGPSQLPPSPQAPQLPSPQPQQPVAQPRTQPSSGHGSAAGPTSPISSGVGGGSASWPQQAHQLARPDGSDQPVVPWKPPVSDPFLQAAQAQAAARPAGLGKRLAARLIDTLVLGVVVGALAVPLFAKARTHIDQKIEAARQTGETVTVWLLDATTASYLGGVLVALLIVGLLYEALPTAKWGRTLGKKLCGLEVRDIETHEAPAFGAALRRWLVYSVLGMLVLGVLNVVWCLFDRPWRQCWHDKVAHTFVAG
nr:RDD family protein [Streptomyces sp. NBC_00857]